MLPLTQLISGFEFKKKVSLVDQSLPPPPPPPEETPPPPEPEEEEEEPELEDKPPPLSLAQLEVAMDAGDGGAGNNLAGGFAFNFTAMDDLIFELADLDQIPTPTHQVAPVHPYKLQREGISGEVVVEFICDAKGNVRSARVVKSTNREFNESALTAIRLWKFTPGEKDGRRVRTKMRLPFGFTVNR
jgi:protein TonB